MTRRGGHRIDSNHTAIVTKLRELGYVVQDLSAVGGGCPDIMVGVEMEHEDFGGSGRTLFIPINLIFEIKSDEKTVKKLNERIAEPLTRTETVQIQWHKKWYGQKQIVSTVEEIVDTINMYRWGDFRRYEAEQGFG